ncbi:putative ester cyclase [Frankia sp. AiPs1]|uniref:ester cyclase n=1 Tax=Frankia sp. AiPa1 TaxID=573492 RepID=UPI00202AC62C|nr:ester cyclase [Frankia sp. AiPa1]MCL9762828.1 ester cyclase [Frankia sp. AiPa1]
MSIETQPDVQIHPDVQIQPGIAAQKDIARRIYEEVVNHGRVDLLETFIADDGDDTTRARSGWSSGRDGFVEHVQWLRTAVPDVRTTVTDLLAEGNRVVVYWRIEGTQRGELFGVAPTGRRIDATSISLFTFRNGQVINYSVQPDRLTILRQLGAVEA